MRSKATSRAEGVTFDRETIVRTAFLFERFKIETFITSGVAPKRYFGFLDERGVTAPYEKILRNTARTAAAVLNEYASAHGLSVRVTAKEIIVTHLAEGAALLLTDELDSVDRVHPVRHIGLDDFRIGFRKYPGLMPLLDDRFGTKLDDIIFELAGKKMLLRPMTFTESVLGTAVMYLYEKDLTEQKRRNRGLPSLMTLSLDEQFAWTALVYNSGILFSEERVRQIMDFATGDYLAGTSERSAEKRPRLPVYSPDDARTSKRFMRLSRTR